MKTVIGRTLSALALAACLGGCSPLLKPEGGVLETANTGATLVPGGGGKTTDDLDFDADFKLFNMYEDYDAGQVTGPKTFGRYQSDGKYHVQGMTMISTSNLAQAGYSDAMIAYYDRPFAGEFKISARIRMTAIASLSSSKGIHIGGIVPLNPPLLEDPPLPDPPNGKGQVFSAVSRSAGILARNSKGSSNPVGELRRYYADTTEQRVNFSASSSSDPFIQPISYKNEYLFEVSRNAAGYDLAVLNSKTGTVFTQGSISADEIFAGLRFGEPVFAAISLLGTSAEISQIKIWDNAGGAGDPVFQTPDTHWGYVPVDQVEISVNSPAGNKTASYSNTFANAAGGITLFPVVEPDFADNKRVEWFVLSCEPAGAMSIAGETPYEKTINGVLKTTYSSGRVTVMGAGTAVFLAVVRDLDLDDFDPAAPPIDYALTQTLAEYAITITITL